MNNKTASNPLLCDPETGVCEIPMDTPSVSSIQLKATNKPIHIVYFTDPICSSCWGIEPQLRKLKLEYGADLDIEYRMGGLLPSWDIYNSGGISKPSDVAHHWEEVSQYYDMPIDGGVWLEDPLSSSYPPSIAFKAAQMQDKTKAIAFLRRIREMVFLEKKNITKWEHLEVAASEVGLNIAKMKNAMEGDAKVAFQEDLNLARQMGVRGFPSIFISDGVSSPTLVYGVRPYSHFEQSILKVAPQIHKTPYDIQPKALFNHYPTLTTKEFAVLSNLSTDDAEKVLKDLFNKNLLKQINTKNGALWIGKTTRF